MICIANKVYLFECPGRFTLLFLSTTIPVLLAFFLFSFIGLQAQRNDEYRGPKESVQHSRGVHYGARALLNIYLKQVWLYRSPIPVGRRGIFYLFK
jgi:hypothetical protein